MTKIIADCCANHMGDRRIMEAMIKAAANVGVDIVKFQSFKADRLNKRWPDYQKAYEYYKSVELSDDDHVFILEKCREYGIKPLFTAFDVERAGFLAGLGIKNVKIASPDAGKEDFVLSCADNFYDIFISCGMITEKQRIILDRCFNVNHDHCGVKWLYCVSKYPTPYEEIDFDKMQLFDGFSDHTADLRAAKKAIDMGMGYIERHFTLGKWLPGKDHVISSTPDEFRELVEHRDYKVKCELYKKRWNGA